MSGAPWLCSSAPASVIAAKVTYIFFSYFTVTRQVCNFQRNCNDGFDEQNCAKTKCSFDGGDFCNWYVDNPSRTRRAVAYTWLAQQGATGSSGTGPTKDHTTGTRLILILEQGSRIECENQYLDILLIMNDLLFNRNVVRMVHICRKLWRIKR